MLIKCCWVVESLKIFLVNYCLFSKESKIEAIFIILVAMSIMASFTSAISILGFSQEMYLYGSMYWLIGFSYFFTQPIAALIYVPFFHNLKITSAYEYLEKRFNNYVRVTASLIFCIEMLLEFIYSYLV